MCRLCRHCIWLHENGIWYPRTVLYLLPYCSQCTKLPWQMYSIILPLSAVASMLMTPTFIVIFPHNVPALHWIKWWTVLLWSCLIRIPGFLGCYLQSYSAARSTRMANPEIKLLQPHFRMLDFIHQFNYSRIVLCILPQDSGTISHWISETLINY